MLSSKFLRAGFVLCRNFRPAAAISCNFESDCCSQQRLKVQKDFPRAFTSYIKPKSHVKSRKVEATAVSDDDDDNDEFNQDYNDMSDDEDDGGDNTPLPVEYAKFPKMNFSRKVTKDASRFLDELYAYYPALNEYDRADVQAYFLKMGRCGVKTQKALEMLAIHPPIINIREETIYALLGTLTSFGLKEKQRFAAIRRAPQLLQMSPKKIAKCNEFLKSYFTSDQMLSLLSKSLNIFLHSPVILREKLDYLLKDMSHEPKNLVNCKALEHPLKHIKVRHQFLVRSGFFKPIPYRRLMKVLEKEYKDRNKARAKYFKPLEVVCYNDVDFLKVCTNNCLSLNELAAFEEMYEAELTVLDQMKDENEALSQLKASYGSRDGSIVEDDDLDDDDPGGAVSLVSVNNSTGFLNDADAPYCYF